jgi:ABC-type nitrate/sulfonate/bicarbonate transport system substrate-binding protein
MKTTTRSAVLLAGIAATTLLAGCATPAAGQGSSSDGADAPVKLVVAVTTLYGYTPLFQALDLQPEGVEVEYVTTTGGTQDTNSAVESGQIDISDQGDIGPLTGNAAGSNIKAIACTYPNSDNIKYLVGKDSGIDSFTDLVGKKIALPVTSNHGLLLHRLLDKNGLEKDAVEWVNIFGPDATTALRTGEIDARSVNAPESLHNLEAYPELKEIDGIAGTVSNRYCLQSAQATVDAKSDAVSTFLSAAASAVLWAKENPAEAAAITQAVTTGYSVDTLTETYELSGNGYQVLDEAFFDEAQAFTDVLRAVEFLDREVDARDVYITDFNDVIDGATASDPRK